MNENVKKALEQEQLEDADDVKSLTANEWKLMGFKLGEFKKIEKVLVTM
jgi:hypothetical protein